MRESHRNSCNILYLFCNVLSRVSSIFTGPVEFQPGLILIDQLQQFGPRIMLRTSPLTWDLARRISSKIAFKDVLSFIKC